MKKIVFILLLFITGHSFAQQQYDNTTLRSWLKLNGKLVVGISNSTSSSTKDSTKLITERAAKLYADSIAASTVDTFTSNITVYGTSFGKYGNGSTIPAQGKTAKQVIADAVVQAIAPTYYNPSASISASPTSGIYEIGYNLGTVTLSSSFNQNDAGSLTATTYYQNGSSLGGNTTTISSLTSAQSFYVNKAYSQGACKNNNLGVQDCSGRINSGSTNSATIYFTPSAKYYIGTSTTLNPTDAEIRAAAVTWSSTKAQNNVNIAVSGTKYVFYAYPSSLGTLTRIYNSLGDFTLDSSGWLLTVNSGFYNAQSYNVSLNVYVLQAAQSGNVNGLNFQ